MYAGAVARFSRGRYGGKRCCPCLPVADEYVGGTVEITRDQIGRTRLEHHEATIRGHVGEDAATVARLPDGRDGYHLGHPGERVSQEDVGFRTWVPGD